MTRMLILLTFCASTSVAAGGQEGGMTKPDSIMPNVTPKLVRDIDKVIDSKAFRMTYIGVPLVIGGLVVKGEDDHFQRLRNDYMPIFNRHLDDYMQCLPAAVMLGMKTGGVESRSSWKRMLVSDAFSAVIMATVVGSLKSATHVTRPDGSNNNSFPSGHTATAFMAATMMSKEYGSRSAWYSIGAYSVATATGLMRMANNKHWLSDVLAGAGFGILSTELGYCFADIIFKENGITHFAGMETHYPANPSFAGLYPGLNVLCGKHKMEGNSQLRFSSGSTAGVEGAWFRNQHIGIGGRFGISNAAVIWNNEAQDESLDFMSVYAGAYLSYPIVPRLLIGSKLLAGYIHTPGLRLSGINATNSNSIGLSTGLSLTFRMETHLGIRISADYEMQPSILRTVSRKANHVLSLGGAACVTF